MCTYCNFRKVVAQKKDLNVGINAIGIQYLIIQT